MIRVSVEAFALLLDFHWGLPGWVKLAMMSLGLSYKVDVITVLKITVRLRGTNCHACSFMFPPSPSFCVSHDELLDAQLFPSQRIFVLARPGSLHCESTPSGAKRITAISQDHCQPLTQTGALFLQFFLFLCSPCTGSLETFTTGSHAGVQILLKCSRSVETKLRRVWIRFETSTTILWYLIKYNMFEKSFERVQNVSNTAASLPVTQETPAQTLLDILETLVNAVHQLAANSVGEVLPLLCLLCTSSSLCPLSSPRNYTLHSFWWLWKHCWLFYSLAFLLLSQTASWPHKKPDHKRRSLPVIKYLPFAWLFLCLWVASAGARIWNFRKLINDAPTGLWLSEVEDLNLQ